MNPRHYRTTLTRLILYPYIGLGLLIGLIVTLVPRGPIVLHICTAVGVLVLVWLLRRTRVMGVAVTSEGMVVYNWNATHRLKWSDVDRLDTRRWGINHEVGIWLKNGRRVRTSLIQGRVVRWQEGKTVDIMSVFQEDIRSRG